MASDFRIAFADSPFSSSSLLSPCHNDRHFRSVSLCAVFPSPSRVLVSVREPGAYFRVLSPRRAMSESKRREKKNRVNRDSARLQRGSASLQRLSFSLSRRMYLARRMQLQYNYPLSSACLTFFLSFPFII